MGSCRPYLLGTAGGSHPTPPTGVGCSSLVFRDDMWVSGAWPAPFGPGPCPPQSSLQVLKDDSAVVEKDVGDTAGAEPGPDGRDAQQHQQ